jgi:KipI family sensor histidine kinase inhibitor
MRDFLEHVLIAVRGLSLHVHVGETLPSRSMEPKLSPAGDRALLADLGNVPAGRLHAAAAAVRRIGGVLACVVGQQSLYVVFDRPCEAADQPRIESAIERSSAMPLSPRTHKLEVSFAESDAIDLPELLGRAGLSRSELISRIAGVHLTARYLGFRAGFAYLDGWPAEWSMPRRPTSRARVPRGSFAIAEANAGFYAIDSPGGWNIIGRTAAPLWDARRDPPNLIASGDEIEIAPVERLESPPAAGLEFPPPPAFDSFAITANAQFVTVVTRADWSRAEHGLPPGGPYDVEEAAAANRLVGNDDGAPLLECAMVGPRLRFIEPCIVAWNGAECDLQRGTPFSVKAGDEVDVGRIRGGLRGWLAVGAAGRSSGSTDRPSDPRPPSRDAFIRVIAGPHTTPLREITCEVTAQLNRVGIRMRPLQPIAFDVPADLPSCGMQFGTIQLHPDGTVVAMGPDHPVTGGYLQPMTVPWDERWKLGQLKAGDKVTFVC